MDLSVDAFGDRIGFESSIVDRIETDSGFIDSLPIEVVITIAEGLNIPSAGLLLPDVDDPAWRTELWNGS